MMGRSAGTGNASWTIGHTYGGVEEIEQRMDLDDSALLAELRSVRGD